MSNYFQEHYPLITELYYDYLNTDSYQKHPMTRFVDADTDDALNRAIVSLKEGDEDDAYESLLHSAVSYEHGGFILGFTMAMNIMSEVKDIVPVGGVK